MFLEKTIPDCSYFLSLKNVVYREALNRLVRCVSSVEIRIFFKLQYYYYYHNIIVFTIV